MRILFVTHYSTMYGANKSLLYLMKDLRLRYNVYPVVLIPQKGSFSEELEKENIEYIVIKFHNWMGKKCKSSRLKGIAKDWINRKQCWANKALLEKYQFDIVHSNSSVCSIGAYISQKLGKKHIWHIREFGKSDYDLEYENSIRFVKKCYGRAEQIVTISGELNKVYSDFISQDKMKMIYNGIHINKDYKKEGTSNPIVNFCIVGLLTYNKNQLEVIEASKLLIERGISNFCLNIIGEGDQDYTNNIKAIVNQNGMEQYVKLWGYRNDVDVILNNMHVGIVPSKKEAFGRVTIEYMAKWMPVIGANTGGTKELIVNNMNGYLYELGSAKDLADKMQYFIENRQDILGLGKQAFEYSIENFSVEKNTDKIYNLYQQALNMN